MPTGSPQQCRGPARVTQSIDYLFTDPERHTLDADARAHAMELAPLWCRLYAIADTLAQDLQAQFKWDWKLLCVFGFIAFVCFAFFAHLGSEHKFSIVGYSLSFVVIFVLFARAMLGQDQERYLDYRALAEALRVAVYWKLLGIGSRYLDAKAGASRPRRGDRHQSGRHDRACLSDQATGRAGVGEDLPAHG